MISFALFSVQLLLPGGKTFELTARDLSVDGFTFRLTPEDAEEFIPENRPAFSGLLLTHRGLKTEKSLTLTDFTVTPEESDSSPYALTFRLYTEDPQTRCLLKGLMSDLLTYEEQKNNGTDRELSRFYTGYDPEAEPFSAPDFTVYRRELCAGLRPTPDWKAAADTVPHTAWILSSPSIQWEYLGTEPDMFFSAVLQRCGLDAHPMAQRIPDTLIIGNAFCPSLFPDGKQLFSLVERCRKDGLTPVISVPPLPEHRMDPTVKSLTRLPAGLTVSVNDAGLARRLRTICPDRFRLTAGPLLIRRRKDPRIPYWTGKDTDLRETSADSPSFRSWLADLGIRESWREACGYPVSTDGVSGLILPFYQCATATRCILEPLLTVGRRDYPSENTVCGRECEHSCLLYSGTAAPVGRFNSLFGFNRKIMENADLLRETLSPDVQCLILDLLL